MHLVHWVMQGHWLLEHPDSSKMFTKKSARSVLYGTQGMSQHWILDISPLKPLWKMRTNDAICSARKRCQFCALKDFLSNCKVTDIAVQAFELFLYVAVKIWKRRWRTLQCPFGGARQAGRSCLRLCYLVLQAYLNSQAKQNWLWPSLDRRPRLKVTLEFQQVTLVYWNPELGKKMKTRLFGSATYK